ncbi:hypothetical protein GQ53DRAFT_802565 [Thozetella sp. PMI_491]|nr:hypothetical protein GQ53DRAFT_802565 [Thozetella sp. PMI_491]
MARFSSLPLELKDRVLLEIFNACDAELTAICTSVCREWQCLMERYTFENIWLTPARVKEASRIITPHRQALVRHLSLAVILDPYDEYENPEETEQEHQENCERFTAGVTEMLRYLATWERTRSWNPDGGWGLALDLDVYSLSDPGRSDIASDEELRETSRWDGASSFLEFVNEGVLDIPTFRGVVSFCVYPEDDCVQRNLAPLACCQISSLFLDLEAVVWTFVDGSVRDEPKRRLRQEFATGLSLIPASVKYFRLFYEQTTFNEEPPFVDPILEGEQGDPLSIALRKLSQQLVQMNLEWYGQYGTEVFWPIEEEENVNVPEWEHLESLYVTQGIFTPNQGNLFTVPKGEEDVASFQDLERCVLDSSAANSFLRAAGRAASRMPKLHRIGLDIRNTTADPHDPKCSLGILYMVDGPTCSLVVMNPDIELEAETQTAWDRAAEARTGQPRCLEIVRPEPLADNEEGNNQGETGNNGQVWDHGTLDTRQMVNIHQE